MKKNKEPPQLLKRSYMEVPLVEFQNINLKSDIKLPNLQNGCIFNSAVDLKMRKSFSKSTPGGVKKLKLVKGIQNKAPPKQVKISPSKLQMFDDSKSLDSTRLDRIASLQRFKNGSKLN